MIEKYPNIQISKYPNQVRNGEEINSFCMKINNFATKTSWTIFTIKSLRTTGCW